MRPQNVLRELPDDPKDRKGCPITTGVLDYFPLALAEVARVSKAGNDQHNPGQPLHWSRGKSGDHADCVSRHLIQRGELDKDGMRHSAKMAWRALAILQEELEDEAGFDRTDKFVDRTISCAELHQSVGYPVENCHCATCQLRRSAKR